MTAYERTGDALSLVRAEFDLGQYPPRVESAKLEIRWYTNGDYNFHYVETHENAIWQCRWNRHSNPHTNRTHFHPPPEANSEGVTSDSPPDQHPSAMMSRTLANIRERISNLWQATDQ